MLDFELNQTDKHPLELQPRRSITCPSTSYGTDTLLTALNSYRPSFAFWSSFLLMLYHSSSPPRVSLRHGICFTINVIPEITIGYLQCANYVTHTPSFTVLHAHSTRPILLPYSFTKPAPTFSTNLCLICKLSLVSRMTSLQHSSVCSTPLTTALKCMQHSSHCSTPVYAALLSLQHLLALHMDSGPHCKV